MYNGGITVKSELENLLGPPLASFKLNRNFTIHLIDLPRPGAPTEVFGSYGYRDIRRHAYREQCFYLTVGEELFTKTSVKELVLVTKLGAAVEKHFGEYALQVIDVRLPKSHGYGGNKYGYRQVMELFPDLR